MSSAHDKPGQALADDSAPLSPGKIAAASAALGTINADLERMWRLAGAALEPNAGRATIDSMLKPLQADILSTAQAAQFDGGAWLWPVPPVAASANTNPAGPLLLTYQPAQADGSEDSPRTVREPRSRRVSELEAIYALPGFSAESDILGFITSGASTEAVQTIRQSIAEALVNLTTARTFLDALETVLSESPTPHLAPRVRSLVDADLDEGETREVALETQQQLCEQPLSIANDNTSMMLRLFG